MRTLSIEFLRSSLQDLDTFQKNQSTVFSLTFFRDFLDMKVPLVKLDSQDAMGQR